MLLEQTTFSVYPLANGNVLFIIRTQKGLECAVVDPEGVTLEQLNSIVEPINKLAKGKLIDTVLVEFRVIKKFCVVRTYKRFNKLYRTYQFLDTDFNKEKVGSFFSTEGRDVKHFSLW